MRFRRLKINIQTTGGPYGVTLDFADGLVVIWADNSMGKSTCVKAILIALGMEAMLGTSQQELPLPPAVKTRLDSETGEHTVLESEVFLEIENFRGDRIVVQRTIKGSRDKNLITVHTGPALTSSESKFPSKDYFVSRAGAATRENGFHYFLTSFLGWELPNVQTYDGNEVPLYLQCVFPYFVVEQTRGWSTALPPIPTQFRIRDAHKRSIEFLLNMDAHRVALLRQSLQYRKSQLEANWSAQARRAGELAESAGGTVQALPKQPLTAWPPEISPTLTVPDGERWVAISDRLQSNSEKLKQLVNQEIPRVAEITVSAQTDLAIAEQDVQTKQTLLNRLLEAFEAEGQEVARIKERLSAINEDIQRNKDVRTLKKLGSRKESSIEHGACPVCHQEITDSLVPLPDEQSVMSLDENIDFLTEQRRTFRGLLANSERVLEARRQQVRALRDSITRLREKVRVIRQTLISDGRLPSMAAIYARVELESQIKQDSTVTAQAESLFEEFSQLAQSWNELQKELLKLPDDDVTLADRAKIVQWTDIVRNQLSAYGFGSFDAQQVVLSQDTYRPEHDGFDLQTSISASDLIRTIWALLNGLLELSRTTKTNHPGCVLFDEPRQQSARDVSFAALMHRAASAKTHGQQVIFFTSEDRTRLERHLADVENTFIAIEGRVLKHLQ